VSTPPPDVRVRCDAVPPPGPVPRAFITTPLDVEPAVRTIPVVFHIIWHTSDQNVSDAQVASQIDALNADFRNTNPDAITVTPPPFQPLIADARIVFQQAGITRTKTDVADGFYSFEDDMKNAATGGHDPWDTDYYLNVWICDIGGINGTATFPTDNRIQGVVINPISFGVGGSAEPPYDGGRTLVHEVGHYLNLHHVWGDGYENPQCTLTDYVDDTPVQFEPNYGIVTFPHVSCNNGPDGDLFVNHMDYTDDVQSVMWTPAQVARMHDCLLVYRKNLGVNKPGTPDPDPPPEEPQPSKTAAYDLGDDPKAMLGVPEYHAYLFDRSGQDRIKEIAFTSLSWNRVIDNYSEASITIEGDVFGTYGEDLRNIIDCWKYEIGIYRNNSKVWCGPITNVEMEAGALVISAADISVWLQRRLIYHDWKFKQVDLAWIATWIVQDAMSVDNVPGLHADFKLTGIKGDRDYRAKAYLSAADELDELTRTSVDWTVVNRHMIVGNFEIPATPIAHLVQEHLANDPGISIVGGAMGTGFYVIGSAPTETVAKAVKDPPVSSSAQEKELTEAEKAEQDALDALPKVVGVARGGKPSEYGVHDRVVTESSILDTVSARANAKSRLDVLKDPPIVFSNATLVPTAPINVDQLIPGRVISVLLEYPRESRGEYRIKALKGQWAESIVNDIQIDFEPAGTVDVSDAL
jgi:hypothetical protein